MEDNVAASLDKELLIIRKLAKGAVDVKNGDQT